MGWINGAAPEHEGYLVAIAREDDMSPDGLHVMRSRYRELSGLVGDEETLRRYDGVRISIVQVACDCGWRSPRLSAPIGTTWRPHAVWIPSRDEGFEEELAHELWAAHVREYGRAEILDSLAGGIVATTRCRFDRATGRYEGTPYRLRQRGEAA